MKQNPLINFENLKNFTLSQGQSRVIEVENLKEINENIFENDLIVDFKIESKGIKKSINPKEIAKIFGLHSKDSYINLSNIPKVSNLGR